MRNPSDGDPTAGGLLSPLRTPAAGELLADRIMTADALARVVTTGLLEVRRGRSGGAFVRRPWTTDSARAVRDTLGPRWAELESTFDMRHLVEALVARTAAE